LNWADETKKKMTKEERKILPSKVVKSKGPKEEDDFDDENMSLMIKKFTKFMKGKNKGHHKRYKNDNQNFVSNYNCYGCGETGHIKVDCSNTKKSKEKKGKKFFKKKKWEDNDSSSSSSSFSSSSNSSESDEEANLCLIVNRDSSNSKVSSCRNLCLIVDHDSFDNEISSYSNDNDHDSLYNTFQQLLHKSNKLDVAHKISKKKKKF